MAVTLVTGHLFIIIIIKNPLSSKKNVLNSVCLVRRKWYLYDRPRVSTHNNNKMIFTTKYELFSLEFQIYTKINLLRNLHGDHFWLKIGQSTFNL